MGNEFSYLSELGSEKGDLIKGLQLVQSREGYVSDDAIRAISKHFSIAEAEVEGVLTFYAQFKRTKPGKYKICVCDGTACHVRHSIPILEALYRELGVSGKKKTTDDMLFTVETVSCLGACGLAPVMTIDDKVHPAMTPEKALALIAEIRKEELADA